MHAPDRRVCILFMCIIIGHRPYDVQYHHNATRSWVSCSGCATIRMTVSHKLSKCWEWNSSMHVSAHEQHKQKYASLRRPIHGRSPATILIYQLARRDGHIPHCNGLVARHLCSCICLVLAVFLPAQCLRIRRCGSIQATRITKNCKKLCYRRWTARRNVCQSKSR